MKFLSSILLLVFSITIAYGQDSAVIKGHISRLNDHNISIQYKEDGKRKKIVVPCTAGEFEVTLSVAHALEVNIYPEKYFDNAVQIKGSKSYLIAPPLLLFVAPGDVITVEGDAMQLWTATTTGGQFSKQLAQFNKSFVPLTTAIFNLSSKQQNWKNQDLQDSIKKVREEIRGLASDKKRIVMDYITAYPDNLFSLNLFTQRMGGLSTDKVNDIYNQFPVDLQQSFYGTAVKDFMTKNENAALGKEMIPFSGKSLTGEAIHSSDFRGKYLLLDFWGSWCQPCRKSHPHLLALYNKYKSQGFEIVGIAQERGSDPISSWKKAIKEDDINWIHLLNNQQKEKQDLVSEYHVSAFPTKILIDPTGKIIWKGIGNAGNELDSKLAELFGE
ncbi:TlpA family protein disulfide reductase [Sphingobacterium sp. ML3W]|uniref:TlpA family protein disulfide reductase n=1 Tax=Sphingobacterium sp. ML3W TaxID=1538644 RepID=UPI00068C3E28|nr:TlpA disulfide reductase family protein [Sphingobacterium sp. ML3W]